jgi:hypothetical protein
MSAMPKLVRPMARNPACRADHPIGDAIDAVISRPFRQWPLDRLGLTTVRPSTIRVSLPPPVTVSPAGLWKLAAPL